jgi:hypothetical protein
MIFYIYHSIRNKNRLGRPCLLTDQDEISHLYRGPFIDASYQVSVHLAKRFQRRRFLKIDQSETRIACGGHVCLRIGTKWAIFIEDFPYILPTKFQFIWLRGFQRRRLKCEKLTDDRRRTTSDGKSSHCLWQGELKIGIGDQDSHWISGLYLL